MKNTFKIDIKFLNSLNDAYAGSTYFNDWAENPEIVPTDLEHKKLLQNHTISPEIYKYYNRVNLFEPLTDSLFEDWKDAFKSTLLEKWFDAKATPYNLKICNAYYYRPDFLFKLGAIVYDSPVYFDGKEIKDLLDLKDYYLEYAKGFNEGYKSFMDNKIKSHYDIFADRKTYLNKVFEFITARPTHKKHYWGRLTFKSDFSKNILGAYEDGLLQGYYYQAWTIVFKDNDFFAPLFKGVSLKPIKRTVLKDFFSDLTPTQIEELKVVFQDCKGIEMACFIHQMVKNENLVLVKNSQTRSLKKFCATFSKMNTSDYEAVRKLFKYDSYFLENENYLKDYKTKVKIKTALKVG